MRRDLEQFLGLVPIKEVESQVEIDYFDLLTTTFQELKTELETNGNTNRFWEIQKERGQQILAFWRKQVSLYQQAVAEGKIASSTPLRLEDGSVISVAIARDYYRDDENILHIAKRSKNEEHEVSITVSEAEDTGLDEFLHPPRIKSEFNREDKEREEYIFEIIFRAGKISTMTRAISYTHEDYQLPFVKQVETLDTPRSFGVETPESLFEAKDQGKI